MQVIVVGAGVGGLAAAIAVHRAGATPIVLEQAPELSKVGAGINVSANGMRALSWLGADRHVRETSVYSEGSTFFDLRSGAQVARQEFGSSGERVWGESFYHVLRADLIDALLGRLPDGSLRLGSAVAAVDDHGDRVEVRLRDGEVIAADAVIGADGLNSTVRRGLFGEQQAHRTGYVAWRSLIDLARWPALDRGPSARNWVGPRRHIITYPVSGRKFLNFVGFVPDDEVASRESWTASGDVSALRESFAGSCADVDAMLEAIDEAFITAINFREPLRQWGAGNTVLLGDAAHPVPPSAAQGACMALEDAVVLGESLLRSSGAGFESAAAEYARRRRPRTNRLFGVALNNFRTFNQSDPLEVRGRNGRLRGLERLDPLSEATWGWIYGHDVTRTLDDAALPGLTAAATVNPLVRPEARRAFDRWRDALVPTDFVAGEVSLRAGLERFLTGLADPSGPQTAVRTLRGDVPVLEASTGGAASSPVVLHLHGGLFTMGSAQADLAFATRVARAVGGDVVVPDYRLAPEHESPAALDDVVAVYRDLRESTDRAVFVSGIDAGAGLAVGLCVRAREEGLVPPDGLFLVSPFVDLALQSPSIDANATTDPLLSRQFLAVQAASYIHGADPEDPAISPVYADLRGLPPLRVFAAVDEALADDARRLVEAASAAGVDAELVLVDDTVHAFARFDELPETQRAFGIVGEWAARTPAPANARGADDAAAPTQTGDDR